MDKIAEIRARCAAATPGPWRRTGSHGHLFEHTNGADEDITTIIGEVWGAAFMPPEDQRVADIEFIVRAREDIPALLDALNERDAENARLTEKAKTLEANFLDAAHAHALAATSLSEWRNRAETLEQTIRRIAGCKACEHVEPGEAVKCTLDYPCDGSSWKLAQRFGGEE